jgi:putative transposase
MQKLQTAYTCYFNKRLYRTGALFEGTFKAEHVDTDKYLKYLYTYIHLNPIGIIDKGWKQKQIINRKKAEEFLYTYEYSSLFDFMEKDREVNKILDGDHFPEYFKNKFEFDSMLREWMQFSISSVRG